MPKRAKLAGVHTRSLIAGGDRRDPLTKMDRNFGNNLRIPPFMRIAIGWSFLVRRDASETALRRSETKLQYRQSGCVVVFSSECGGLVQLMASRDR